MAFYFLPGVMYERFIEAGAWCLKEQIDAGLINKEPSRVLRSSYKIYKLCIQKYWGFGFMSQFFPGTEANKARNQLAEALEGSLQILREDIRAKGFSFEQLSYLLPLYSYLNLGPLFALVHDSIESMKKLLLRGSLFKTSDLFLEEKDLSLGYKILLELPIIKDILKADDSKIRFKKDVLPTLLHCLLNPFKIINDTLDLLYNLGDLAVVGTEGELSLSEKLINGITNALFVLIKLPVIVAQIALDLVLKSLKALLIDPLSHFATSIKKACQIALNQEPATLVATVQELRELKTFKKAVKDRRDGVQLERSFGKDEVLTKEYSLACEEFLGKWESEKDEFDKRDFNKEEKNSLAAICILPINKLDKDAYQKANIKTARNAALFKVLKEAPSKNEGGSFGEDLLNQGIDVYEEYAGYPAKLN